MQDAFEVWAKSHGGLPLIRADETLEGLFPATYLADETEIAWRAWANKPASDALDAARYRFLRDGDLDALAAANWGNGEVYIGEQFDEAVDAAIAALKEQS